MSQERNTPVEVFPVVMDFDNEVFVDFRPMVMPADVVMVVEEEVPDPKDESAPEPAASPVRELTPPAPSTRVTPVPPPPAASGTSSPKAPATGSPAS